MDITGRVFEIQHVSDKLIKLVIKKRVQGKTVPIAFAVFGFWRDVVIKELRIKKGDKISAIVVLKSNLYKGKWYTDASMKNIELIPDKKTIRQESENQISFITENNHFIDETTGEILL